MSGSSANAPSTAKAGSNDASQAPALDKQAAANGAGAGGAMEEDDEFEDFPVEDWPAEETEAGQKDGANAHLWEESWDDDDANDDFAKSLKEEIARVGKK